MRTITSLTISSTFGPTISFDGVNYLLEEIQGLESPLVRLSRYNLPGSSGAYISNMLYGERAIKIKGVVQAPDGSRVTYLNNRTTLINACAIQHDNQGNLLPQTLTITLENGITVTTQVFTDPMLQMGFSPENVDYEEFLITFIAADPNLYSTTVLTSAVTLPIGGGTPIPTAIPLSLAPSAGGSVVITNPGSQPSSPIITLSAPLTNPYITNLRTGGFLSLNYTLTSGSQSIIINCATGSITQGVNNLIGIQSEDSTFWQILSGANTIAFSAAAGSGNATIAYFAAFIGL